MKTALIIILVLILVGFGVYAFTSNDDYDTDNGANVACTMDAKLCPDGSYVGRVGPNCEFAACPGTGTTSGMTGTVVGGTNATSTGLTATSSISLPRVITVTYTSAGFSPKTAIIGRGGTVTFVNKSGDRMWIASDPHPTHNGYPAFDQRASVGRDGTWSFTFDTVGAWPYHNHSVPTLGGTIVVQ